MSVLLGDLICLLLLLWVVPSLSSSPTSVPVQIHIKKSLLESWSREAVDLLTRDLTLKGFPDVVDEVDSEDFGSAKFKVKNIKVTKFRCPTPSISLDPERNFVSLSLTDIEMEGRFSLDVSAKYGPFSLENEVGVSMRTSGSALTVLVKLERDEHGMFRMSAGDDCAFSAGDVNLEFEGQVGFLLNMLFEYVKDKFKSYLEQFALRAAKARVDELNARVPKSVPLVKGLEGHYQLARSPLVTTDGMEVHLVVSIALPGMADIPYNGEDLQRIPVLPAPQQISLVVSESLFTENMKNFYNQGFLKYKLMSEYVSSKLKEFLDADCSSFVCLRGFFAEQTANLKGGHFDVLLEATQVPECSIRESKMTLTGKFKLKVDFRSKRDGDQPSPPSPRQEQLGVNRFLASETVVELFTLTFNLSTGIAFAVKDELPTFKLGRLKSTVDPNSIGMSSARLEIILNLAALHLTKGDHGILDKNVSSLFRPKNMEISNAVSFFQLNFDLQMTGNDSV